MALNILLINSPISLVQRKGTIEKLHNISPPLGLAYLAAMVRDLDVKIKIVDAHLLRMRSVEDVRRHIRGAMVLFNL